MKRILPYVIVILVVAFLYFRNKKSNTLMPLENFGGTGGSKFLDLNDTDSIIDSMSLSTDLNKKAKGWVKEIKKASSTGKNGWSEKALRQQALDNEITYAQQLVLSSIWQMYESAQLITREQCSAYSDELLSLSE